jgi:pimeloyl-ACP methyl ester carboxylesterase
MMTHVELANNENKTLRGYLHEVQGDTIVLFLHGFTGNKSEHAYHFRDFARLLETQGISSLRLDYSGNGESDGDFKDFTFDSLMSDVNLMLDFAKATGKRVVVLGFSLGGAAAALLTQTRGQDIYKVVLWSPAGSMLEKIRQNYEYSKDNITGFSAGGLYELSEKMIASLDNYNIYKDLDRYQGKVLVVHGKKDQAVNYIYGVRFAVLFRNAQLHLINSAGHGYDSAEEKKELFDKTLTFLK